MVVVDCEEGMMEGVRDDDDVGLAVVVELFELEPFRRRLPAVCNVGSESEYCGCRM